MSTIKNMLHAIRYVVISSPIFTLLKILLTILLALCPPLLIYITQQLIDEVNQSPNYFSAWMLFWLLFMLLTILLSTAGSRASQLFDMHIKRKLFSRVTTDTIRKYSSIAYQSYENPKYLDIMERIGANPEETLFDSFTGTMEAVRALITVMGSAVIFLVLGPVFATSFLLLLIPLFFFNYRSCKIMADMFEHQSADERRMQYYMGLLSEKQSVFELKVFRAVSYILNRWKESAGKVLSQRIITTFQAQRYMIYSIFLYVAWSVYLLFAVINQTREGIITFGMAIALISALSSVNANIEDFIWAYQSLSETLMSVSWYRSFMSIPERKKAGGETIEPSRFEICFSHVTFTYPGSDSPTLKDVSFSIQSNEHVALVGRNGSGKSTIVKLLCRLYNPDSGTITINGVSLSAISDETIQELFGIVFQDYGKYKLTLRENVAFGNLSKMDASQDLLEALEKTDFPKDKMNLEQIYGRLDDNGTDLSGGEWQKIAISRAYVANRAFVILDEPTAALDPMAESDVYESFQSLMKNKGCMLISHRLASARIADRIIVLDGGQIVQTGNHETLVSETGLYSDMWMLQSSFYQAEDSERSEA